MLRVGFSATDITPRPGAAIPGLAAPRISTGVLDPLQVRSCVVCGNEAALAIVGVDAISLRFDTIERARARIEAACGILARNVLIAASHTHSGGPSNDVFGTDSDEAYCNLIADRIFESVEAAHEHLKEALVAYASGICEGWAFNRRFRMRGGGERTNPRKGDPNVLTPAGPVDPEIGLIAFRSSDGRLLGAIANFACHCTVIGGDKFSGDYPAYWQQAMREQVGENFTLVFLNGACGDINQINFHRADVQERGPEWAKRMGNALAAATIQALKTSPFSSEAETGAAHGGVQVAYRRPSPELLEEAQRLVNSDGPWSGPKWLAHDRLLLAAQIGTASTTFCPVDVLRIGQAAITAAPWQPFCEFGLKVKRASRFRPTLVAAFANGMLGYVPTPQAFEAGGYEPTLCRGSKLAPEAGDQIVAETIRLLNLIPKE